MKALTGFLRLLNYAAGIAIFALGLYSYFTTGSAVALLVVVGLAAVGPLEDLLERNLRVPGVDPAVVKEFVNQGTSLVLLLSLLGILYLSAA